MASCATAPPVEPACWSAGNSDDRKVHSASPFPALAGDGAGDVVDGLAEAGAVDAAGGGLPACVGAVALPPQAAVSRLTASRSARAGRFKGSPGLAWMTSRRMVLVSARTRPAG